MIKLCNARTVGAEDLPMLLEWRNHPNVRRLMLTQHQINLEEHMNWYARASQDPNRCLLIIEDVNQPIGYVQFNQVKKGGVTDWGFYAKPDAPKGTGYKICSAALDYGFGVLRLHKVCGQAVEGNDASIKLHKRLGFSQEGVLRNQRFINGVYFSLYCFGLLTNEWQSMKLLKEDAHVKD